jgi:hypothetical protein
MEGCESEALDSRLMLVQERDLLRRGQVREQGGDPRGGIGGWRRGDAERDGHEGTSSSSGGDWTGSAAEWDAARRTLSDPEKLRCDVIAHSGSGSKRFENPSSSARRQLDTARCASNLRWCVRLLADQAHLPARQELGWHGEDGGTLGTEM